MSLESIFIVYLLLGYALGMLVGTATSRAKLKRDAKDCGYFWLGGDMYIKADPMTHWLNCDDRPVEPTGTMTTLTRAILKSSDEYAESAVKAAFSPELHDREAARMKLERNVKEHLLEK